MEEEGFGPVFAAVIVGGVVVDIDDAVDIDLDSSFDHYICPFPFLSTE